MHRPILYLIILFSIFSCTSRKDIVYLQDSESFNQSQINDYQSVIKQNDLLRIAVTSSKMELIQQYTRNITSVNDPTTPNDLRTNSMPQMLGYLVNSEGYITFPTLGKIKAEGMTVLELQQMLQKEISENVTDAVVDVRIINFKISVLGEVNKPGTFSIQDERITVLQAMGLAGDLTIYGKRDNVKLLREENGVQEVHHLDLTSTDLLNSPYYYLRQNDILLVEPNRSQISSADYNKNAGLWISVASVLVSVIILISNNR